MLAAHAAVVGDTCHNSFPVLSKRRSPNSVPSANAWSSGVIAMLVDISHSPSDNGSPLSFGGDASPKPEPAPTQSPNVHNRAATGLAVSETPSARRPPQPDRYGVIDHPSGFGWPETSSSRLPPQPAGNDLINE